MYLVSLYLKGECEKRKARFLSLIKALFCHCFLGLVLVIYYNFFTNATSARGKHEARHSHLNRYRERKRNPNTEQNFPSFSLHRCFRSLSVIANHLPLPHPCHATWRVILARTVLQLLRQIPRSPSLAAS